jgi:hypothetical protein
MAQIFLQQEDTNGSCSNAQYCSGTAAGRPNSKLAQSGGSAGSTEVSDTMTANLTTRFLMYDCAIPSGASWDGGTWTVRVDVTDGNMVIDLEEIWICRINSSCVNQEEIGSDTTINQVLTTSQVYSFDITGSAVTPSADDRVAIILVCTNNDDMMSQVLGITPSQIIDTPFDDGVAGALKDIIGTGIIPWAR